MASHKIFTHSARGFSLMELLVVMGLFAMVGSMALIVSMDDYRSYSFRGDRDMLIALLEKARSQSINNICIDAGSSCTDGKPHGLHLQYNAGGTVGFVVFQGRSYATRDVAADEVVQAGSAAFATTSPSFTDVVFSQLAATTTVNPTGIATLTVVDGAAKQSVITISSEGQISWSN